jgi:hypothetical protein
VGKSTLFNALLKKQVALAANYPFATVEPNVGVVGVPDERLAKLAEAVKKAEKMSELPPEVPATVKFVDIAGLVKGASKGEGLGNKFLSHIREVDAMALVLRDFADENVIRSGSENPKSDREVLEAELILADMETVEKVLNGKDKDKVRLETAAKIKAGLEAGVPVREITFTEAEEGIKKQLGLLTSKPEIVVLNTDEDKLNGDGPEVRICAKMEAELAELGEQEQRDYLAALGVGDSGLTKLIRKGYEILGLQAFLTAGVKEVRAWTVKRGAKAPEAAGVIHTDFEKFFIKADVIGWQEFVSVGGWTAAREAGKVRQEGRDYVMREGDVVEFKVGV